MIQVLEVFVKTGEIVERDRTPAEQEQYELDLAATQAAEAIAEAQAAEAAAATAAAIAQAKSLGFTDEMIAVMYPSLVS
jgi:hypothetical protein